MANLSERLKSLAPGDWREKAKQAFDDRVKTILAGVGPAELRAILRGDPPTEKPNPRYKVHVTSFLFHIRPKFYLKGSTYWWHTLRLGWLSTIFFMVEIITGMILMVYYVPSPAEAYGSILNLHSNVMFGELMRDIHRAGAEAMVLVVWLHLFRTYFTGSYKQGRSFTWLTGVILLLLTVFLSFSGYLLPWDQLAYWAVTIGTSMADKAPLFGPESNLLVRGAPDIGAGALLRFYLMHVILLPLAGLLVLSIHYYKVSREHGITLPAIYEEGNLPDQEVKEAKKRVDLIPDLFTHELFLTSLVIAGLVIYSAFFYNAPLETHANPLVTPLDTKAPWYFWWVQGMLKLGDPTTMGVTLPTLFVIVLLAIPYIDRNPKRLAKHRPFAIAYGVFWVAALLVLSYMGLPQFGIETPAATRIIQDLAPEEGVGALRAIPFEELVPGTYFAGETDVEALPKELAAVFTEFEDRLAEAAEQGKLVDPVGVIHITDWQGDSLKRLTIRIEWFDPETSEPKLYEHDYYLHRDRKSSH